MSTPNGSSSSYCSVAQLLAYKDARVIGDLVSDDGTRVAAGSLTANAVLAELLKAASGLVEAAALVGGRYTAEDLATTITGNSAALLRKTVAELAMYEVRSRRAEPAVTPDYKQAVAFLEALEKGKRIFALQEVSDAGNVDHYRETSADVEARDGIVVAAQRFFGRRVNRRD